MAWADVRSILGLWNGGTPAVVSDANPVPVTGIPGVITPKHVTATASGETEVIAPSVGSNAIRLYWYHLNAKPTNGAEVVASLRFGTGGTDFFKMSLSQYGGAIAHSFKAGMSYHQGAAGESLLINLSTAQTVYANIDFEEVVP